MKQWILDGADANADANADADADADGAPGDPPPRWDPESRGREEQVSPLPLPRELFKGHRDTPLSWIPCPGLLAGPFFRTPRAQGTYVVKRT